MDTLAKQIIDNLIRTGKTDKEDNAYAYLAGMAFAMLTDEQKNELLELSGKELKWELER